MNGNLFIKKTYSRDEYKGLLESILFVSGKPVRTDELADLLELTKEEVTTLVGEMISAYNERKSGLTIINIANGFQIATNPVYKSELAEIYGNKNDGAITRSCLETLAIIVYKQPVTKEEIDRIRGVSSTRSINTLLTMRFITISGTAESPINSPLYISTERFLEFFRIKSLEDLPPISSLNIDSIIEEPEDLRDADENENQDGGGLLTGFQQE